MLPQRLPGFASVSLATCILLHATVADAREDRSPDAVSHALQVMADLALIDAACRDVVVHWGVGFRFAEREGIAETGILPGGARRLEFETVLRTREASFGPDELCGQIAQNYAEALPGSVTPSFRRDAERP